MTMAPLFAIVPEHTAFFLPFTAFDPIEALNHHLDGPREEARDRFAEILNQEQRLRDWCRRQLDSAPTESLLSGKSWLMTVMLLLEHMLGATTSNPPLAVKKLRDALSPSKEETR